LRNVYERLGVTPIINAKGPSTRVSGGVLAPEVTAAMAEAAGLCVDMADLQAAASRRIATYTGAEAGIVTSGAAAGLLLGTESKRDGPAAGDDGIEERSDHGAEPA
jgi:D-glucosaminate-6-phosphate ammonia-lyase